MTRAKFYTHIFTLGNSSNEWHRDSPLEKKMYSYIFFSRVDPGVTITLEVLEDAATGLFTRNWTKIGINVPRENWLDTPYKVILSGNGTVAFVESQNTRKFCNEKIYPINYPNVTINISADSSSFQLISNLSYNDDFCILYANYGGKSKVLDINLHKDDNAEYTLGKQSGSIKPRLVFTEKAESLGIPTLCFFFQTRNNPGAPRSFTLALSGSLYIPSEDLFPQNHLSFTFSNFFTTSKQFRSTSEFSQSKHFTVSNEFTISCMFAISNHFSTSSEFHYSIEFTESNRFSFSNYFTKSMQFLQTRKFTDSLIFSSSYKFIPKDAATNFISTKRAKMSKTPTQTRKVRILTDDLNSTSLVEIDDLEQVRAKVVKASLSSKEVVAIATSATVSVGMIIVAIILFIIYLHEKAKKLRNKPEFLYDYSDMGESISSCEYSFSYEYYYSVSET